MRIEETYKQLTGVDIDVQRRIWDDRAVGYYGEYLVFCELYKKLEGNGKILMNLEIPVTPTTKTELDLLLIHESGLYVFEIKHYKGTIYGKDTDSMWTQYFRTAKNQVFKNPIQQNGYHLRALNQMFPLHPVYSVIVFTNEDCDVRIENSNSSVNICTLNNMWTQLISCFTYSKHSLSMSEIDKIFGYLMPFSKMQENVYCNGKEAPFHAWLQPILDSIHTRLDEVNKIKETYKKNQVKLEAEYKQREKNLEKSKRNGIRGNIAIAVVCLLALLVTRGNLINKYNQTIEDIKSEYDAAIAQNTSELNKFKQNFLHVDEIDNPYIDDLASYVDVSNSQITAINEDAVSFSATLSISNDIFGCKFSENSKIVVMTDSGTVYEYTPYGDSFKYYLYDKLWYPYKPRIDLNQIILYGISDPYAITYIKMTDISIFKVKSQYTMIQDDLEIELYDKSKQSDTTESTSD